MPRCNLTLKQKCQMIELSGDLSTDQLAKKFRVHPTTVTRTIKNKDKILTQASRVNVNFKTVQTNQRCEEHDTMILEYIKARQAANEPLTIKEICDKAVECGMTLDRNIKSKRGWWRRFKVRCNIIRSKLQKATPGPRIADPATETKLTPVTKSATNVAPVQKDKVSELKSSGKKTSPVKKILKKKNYTFKVKDSVVHASPTSHDKNNTNNDKKHANDDNNADDNNDPVGCVTNSIRNEMRTPQLPDVYEAMA